MNILFMIFFVKNNWFNTLNSESGSKCSVDLGKGTFRRNVPLISTENFGSVVFKVLSKNRGRIPWKFVRNPPLKSKEVLKYRFKGDFRRNRRKIPVPSVLKYGLWLCCLPFFCLLCIVIFINNVYACIIRIIRRRQWK